jgi:hypothetical protein
VTKPIQNKIEVFVDDQFVDLLVAMHSDLFIMNPKSTFSWQVYIVRVALALESVPRLPWRGYVGAENCPGKYMPFADIISLAHSSSGNGNSK